MNRIFTFALLGAFIKSFHSIVIGFVVLATITTASMSYQTVQLNKEILQIGRENQRLLSEINKKEKEQTETLVTLNTTIKEATKSATPSPKVSPKE